MSHKFKKRCRSGAFIPTSWKWLSLMSEERDEEKWIVLVCVLLRTETKRRLTSFIGQETWWGYGERDRKGRKANKVYINLRVTTMGLNLTGDPLRSHREHASKLILQRTKNLRYRLSDSYLWLRVGLWPLHLWAFLDCPVDRLSKLLATGGSFPPQKTGAKQSACTRTLPQICKGTQTLVTEMWKALITYATREETLSAMFCFTF